MPGVTAARNFLRPKFCQDVCTSSFRTLTETLLLMQWRYSQVRKRQVAESVLESRQRLTAGGLWSKLSASHANAQVEKCNSLMDVGETFLMKSVP